MGENIGVDEIATQAQTISYEVLTGVGKRLRRVYLNDSDEEKQTPRECVW